MAYWDFNTGKLVDSNSQSQSIYTPPKKKKKPEDGLSPLVSALMESRRARAELAPPPAQAPAPVVQPPAPTPMPTPQYQPPASLGGGGLTRTLDSAQPAVPPVSGGKYAAEPPKIPWENGANDPLVSGVQRDPSQPGIIGGLVNALKGMADPSNLPEGVPNWQEYEKNTPWGQVKDKTTFGQSWVAGQGQALQIAGAGLDYLGADEIGKRWKEAGRLEIEGSNAPEPKQWEGMKSLLDPEYLATTVTRQIPTALGALLMGAPLAAGGAAAAGAAGLGTIGTTLATGAAAGVPMTVFEAASEAGMAYDDVIAKGGSEEEAGAVGAEIFRKNVAVIGGPNIIEQALIFAPLPQPVKGALKGLGRAAKPMAAAGRIAGTAAMEGGQEGAQEYISMEAQGEPIDRDRIIESIALGGLMGGGMAMPSAVGDMLGREAQGPKSPTPSGGENVLADVLAGRPVATPKPEQATEPAPVIETQDTSKQEMATENASKYTPENLSQIEPTALSAFPDMLETDEGGYSINNFSQNEQDSLRKAGVVITGEDGAERVDAEALWRARENFQKLSREEQKRLYKESNDRMFGATPESSAPSANEAPAPVVAEEKASIEEAAEAPTIPMFGYTNPIVIAIKDEYGMGTVTAIRKAQDNGEKITMEEAIKRGKEEDAASQQRREEYARIAAEQDKAEKEKLQGAKQEPKPQGKYGQIIEGEDGKKKFQVTGKGEESEAVIPEAEVQVEPTSEIAGAVRNVEAEGKAVEDYVKFTIGRREKNNGDRPYTESQRESETESFKELGNKLVDAIANKDVKYLRGWMNGVNPGLNRLFTAVTGLPAKTQKEADASIRSLDPEGYDAWQNDRVQKREQAEQERKQKEAEEKAAKKEAETTKIANSKIKIDGVTDTVENTIRRLYSEGFRVEKTNEYGGIKWVNASTGQEVPLKKMPKELRKYLRALDRRLRDETTTEEYAKEQEEYDALSDEDKAEIDRFLGGESLTQEKTEAAEISDDKIDESVKRVVDEVKAKLDQPQPQEPGPKGGVVPEPTKDEAPKEEAKPTEYPVWKLDVIINDLPKIPADRIKDNPELTRKLYSDKKFTANEVIKLASLYDTEFEKNKIYVTGGYNEGAIKERFEYGREALKRTIWETYVEWREASIQVAMHEKRKAEERKSEPKSESAPEFEITKTKHTKTGEDLWVVKPTKRLSDSEFRQLTVRLKKLGGGWSRFTKGFNFKSDPTAALQPGEAATAPGAKVEPTPAPAEQSPEKPKFAPGEVVIAQDGKSKYLVHSYDPVTNRLVGINPIGGTNTLASNSMTKTGETFTEKEWKDSNFKEAEKLIAHINRGDRVEWVSGGNKLSGAVIRKTELMGQPALEVDTDQAAAPGGVPIRRIEFVTARNSTLKKIEESATEPQEDVAKEPQEGVKSNQGNNNKVETTSEKPTIRVPEAQEGVKASNQSREWLKKMEADARARLEARHKDTRMLAGLPMDDLVDYSIIGMVKLADKTLDIIEFTDAMVKDFGQSIRLFIPAIYGQSKAMLDYTPAEIDAMIELASKEEGGPQDGNQGNSEGTLAEPLSGEVQGTPKDGETPGGTGRSTGERGPDVGNDQAGLRQGQDNQGDGVSGENQDTERGGSGSEGNVPARPSVPRAPRLATEKSNFEITEEDRVGDGGQKTKFKQNVAAIRTLKQIEKEGRHATPEEQAILVKYVGWGGIPQAFAMTKEGSSDNETWEKEFNELKELLTQEEWEAARESTTNAHYTSPEVIGAIYEGLQHLGVTPGVKVLEPSCGVGHFFGMMPKWLRSKTKLTGVEIDSLTGRIATQLYQKADIYVTGYQDAHFPTSFFDLVISNVPFSDKIKLKFGKRRYNLHDYFFMKSLDDVKPGGLVVFITSKGTMDKKDALVRRQIAEKADLVGAIRLPYTAFKGNANTEVTTDLLILRKRAQGEEPGGESFAGLGSVEVEWKYGRTRTDINEYYIKHPEMMMGEMTLKGSMYRDGEARLDPPEGQELGKEIAAALKKLPANIFQATDKVKQEGLKDQEEEAIVLSPELANMVDGAYVIKDNELFQRQGRKLVKIKSNGKMIEKIQHIQKIYKEVAAAIDGMSAGITDEELKAIQRRMNVQYDSFVKKYGYINEPANANLMKGDMVMNVLMSIEDYDTETKKGAKGPIFSKRVIQYQPTVTKAENAKDALGVCLNELGRMDFDRITELTGLPKDKVIEELGDRLYLNPNGDWESAEEYLSGNVKNKLRIAQTAAEKDDKFNRNVEALKEVIPKDVPIDEVLRNAKLGSPWVEKDIVERFFNFHLMKLADHDYNQERNWVKFNYQPALGKWIVDVPKHSFVAGSVHNHSTWGAGGKTAIDLIDYILSMKAPVIKTKDYHTGRTSVDPQATQAAKDKMDAINAEWMNYLQGDKDLQQRLFEYFNEHHNNIAERTYDGSHLTMPKSTLKSWRPHQLNVIWRIIQSGNTLMAHVVGAGKTNAMIGAAMELKRLGLANKPMVVVPNHILSQWQRDINALYPGVKMLVLDPDNMPDVSVRRNKKDTDELYERKRSDNQVKREIILNRIATNDWDIILLPQTVFTRIRLSPEVEREFIQKSIRELEEALLESGVNVDITSDAKLEELSKKSRDRNVKNLAATLLKEKNRLKDLTDEIARDIVIPFDKLGVDRLFVDESHYYKNIHFATTLGNIKGVDNTNAKRSTDMLMKCQWLTKVTNGHGVVFASGTPVSNTMAELFNIMRCLQPGRLEDMSIPTFDGWARMFGQVTTGVEQTVDTLSFKMVSRFNRFMNLRNLRKVFGEVADFQSSKMLNLPTPKLRTGQRRVIVSPEPSGNKKFALWLKARADAIKTGQVDPRDDNFLKITTDARKFAVDPRLVIPSYPEESDGKINMLTSNVADIWRKSKEERSTQIIFADMGTPKTGKAKKGKQDVEIVESVEEGEGTLTPEEREALKQLEDTANLQVYADIKRKLIEQGVSEDEIAFVHDAKNDKERLSLYNKVTAGKIRILIGSTAKCGTGMNVQKKLVALHHLDVPWRPADLEQREGRILRQGNENEEVDIFVYSAEKTYDTTNWQTVQRKAAFIDQFWNGETDSMEDVGELVLNSAQIMALISGNQDLMKKIELENDMLALKNSKSGWEREDRQLRLDIKWREAALSASKKTLRSAKDALKKYEPIREGGPVLKLDATVSKSKDGKANYTKKPKTYTNKEEALFALAIRLRKLEELGVKEKIGELSGFDLYGYKKEAQGLPMYYLIVQNGDYEISNRMTTMDTELDEEKTNRKSTFNFYMGLGKHLETQIEDMEKKTPEIEKNLEELKANLGKPWPKQAEYERVKKELDEVLARLQQEGETTDVDVEDDYIVGADGSEEAGEIEGAGASLDASEYFKDPSTEDDTSEAPRAKPTPTPVKKETGFKEGITPYTPLARAPHESRVVDAKVIETDNYEGTVHWFLKKGVADDKLVKRLEKEELNQKIPDESAQRVFSEAKQSVKHPLIPVAREAKQGKSGVEKVYLAKSNDPGETLYAINADYYDYLTGKLRLTIRAQNNTVAAFGLFDGLDEMVGVVMPVNVKKDGEDSIVADILASKEKPSSLDEALEDLADAVNDAIEEETLPMGQSIKLQFNPFARPGGRARNQGNQQQANEQFHLEDDEIEGRMRGAKGINKETTLSKFKEWIDEFKRKLARGNWEHLSRAKGEAGYYAVLRNALDRLKNQKGVAADKTLRALQGITVDLNPYEYDLFTFKVILDDLKQEADAEHLLPFGFTPESVRSELARIDREIRSYPNVEEALNKRNNLWGALRNARVQAAKAVGVNLENRFTKEDYYRHQVIEYANAKGLYGAGKRLRTPVNRGYMRKRAGSSYDINTDYLQAEFEVMSQMFYDIELDRVIKVVKDDYNIVDSLKAQARTANAERAEGEEKITWQSLIPEGYVEWQPREGSSWYKADSIPAALADQLYADQLEELGIKKEDLRQVFARGQKYGSLVVKEEVAATLNELQKESADVFILNMAHKLTNLWKINVLVGPRRIIKYNLRNLTGDADAVAVGNPKAFGKVAQASGELYQVFKGDRAMTPTMRKWFERGGMQTLLQVQELGEVNSLRMFAQLEKSKGTVKEVPVKLWQKYWKTARISTDFREAILRYANYLEYMEQMGNNPEGKPDNFGASIREEVMALKTIEDRAFKLSNDLLGAYDEISIVGQSLRKYLIPFWSWNEVNFVRYKRLFQNAIYDEKIATFVGKKLVGHLTRSPLLLMRVGKLALKANMMLIILQLWNMLMFPDEEKELPKSVTGRAHIILGRDENGNIIHFTRLGAFQDLLDWFALDTTPQHVTDLLNGNKTIKKIAVEMVKSPFNKLVQGVNPLFKMPPELLLRSEFFPDVFEPRYGSVRDRGLYIAKTLGLEHEYKEIAGLPSKGYSRSIKELAIYLADPEEAAYNRAKEQKYTFLKEASNGGSEGFYYSAKSNALYNYKLAIRYKDKEAAAKYLEEYKLLGGTKEGLDKSIQSLHPLSGLSEKQKEAFKKSLSAEEKETIDRGIAYYKKVVGN